MLLLYLILMQIKKLDGNKLAAFSYDLNELILMNQLLKLVVVFVVAHDCFIDQVFDFLYGLSYNQVCLLFLAVEIIESGENENIVMLVFLN